jgi:outer membrane lipoprotein-sorting protein
MRTVTMEKCKAAGLVALMLALIIAVSVLSGCHASGPAFGRLIQGTGEFVSALGQDVEGASTKQHD